MYLSTLCQVLILPNITVFSLKTIHHRPYKFSEVQNLALRNLRLEARGSVVKVDGHFAFLCNLSYNFSV